MLKQAIESQPRAIRGSKRPFLGWLGPVAALAFSVFSLLVPATALAANETAWSWTQQPSNAAASVAMATNPQLTATGGANLNATIVVTVKVTTTAPAAVPSGTTLSIVAAATASTGWSTSGLSCSADTCTFNAIGTATSAAGPVFTLVDTKVNIASTTGYQLAVSSTNVSAATQSNTFTIGGGNKLGFATAAQTSVGVNSNSSVVIVQLQDSTGVAIAATSDVVVSLTSTSTVTFMNTSFTTIGSAGSASVTITTGASSQSFYFRDSITESPTITATATGYTNGTQTETVTGFGGSGTVYASSLTVSGTPNPSAPNTSVTITGTATTTSTSYQQCFNGISYYPCNTYTYATGYMWFQDSALPQSAICLPTPVTSSGTNIITGTCTYNFATTGAHTITTFYCSTYPTSQFSGFYVYYTCTSGSQTSGTYTQNVNNTVASNTTLTANPTSPTAGQNVTFTAAVSGSGGTPTGSVTVEENGLTKCTITLASGNGTCQAALSEGTHTLTAKYAGDTAFLSSTSSPITVTAGASAPAPSGGTTVGGAPSLPASLVPPPNTNIAAIRAGLAALGLASLAEIPTADVVNSYFGPSAVVSSLIRPPLVTMPFVVGCYSGPNALSDEQAASVLFGTKPAGSQFIIFFIRGTRGYSFDIAVGNYCWIDLM